MKLIDQPSFGESSKWSLIIANLIPIYGVIVLGWKAFDIVIFYWLETIVIGIFNVGKILMSEGKAPKTEEETVKSLGPAFEWLLKDKENRTTKKNDQSLENLEVNPGLKIFLSIFFLIHYNFFIFIQLSFILIFMSIDGAMDSSPDPFDIVNIIYKNTDYLFVGIFGIVFSHAHSFYLNFYKGKEYIHANPAIQMFKPYVRIFVQQFVVIFGGMVALFLGSPLPLLILLVIFKIIIDLLSHNASHKNTFV